MQPDQSSGAVNRSRWTENAARCYKCKDLVPHKLLFVCRHEKCAGVFKGNKKYASPFDFYLHEKVFCSACIFTGSHKNHSDQAEGAYKLAIKSASTGEDMGLIYQTLAFLDIDESTDFMITNDFGIPHLPVADVASYLDNANSCTEFVKRKKMLVDLKNTVDNCRTESDVYVKKLAGLSLNCFQDILAKFKGSNKDSEPSSKKEEKKTSHKDLEKRASDVTLPPAAASPVPDIPKVDSTSISIITTVKVENLKQNDSAINMLCRSLSLRFDQIRDELTIEQALQAVSDMLHESVGSLEEKMAAASRFKERHNVALYYPPQ